MNNCNLNEIEKGIIHISKYLSELKTKVINNLIYQINELETAYEKCYKRNNKILTSFKTLIYNYKSTQINIYDCEYSHSYSEVLRYFNEYTINQDRINRRHYETSILFSIINAKKPLINLFIQNAISFSIKGLRTVDINNIKGLKTITDHTDVIYSLLLLNDNRIASCSNDKTIRIFNPSNNYICEKVIKNNKEWIRTICQLDNGTIVSSSGDQSIIIDHFLIETAHNKFLYDYLSKIISLPNNRFASCSGDTTIKIWKGSPPYSATPIHTLSGHSGWVRSLLYIRERDVLISGSEDDSLRLWNMSRYQCENIIKGVTCCWSNSLYRIDKDRVIVGNKNMFYIVDIDKCKIENTVKDRQLKYVKCFVKLRDNNTIVCGCDNGVFCFYDINTNKYTITKKNHNDVIVDLLRGDDDTFISCSWDKTIKVWYY